VSDALATAGVAEPGHSVYVAAAVPVVNDHDDDDITLPARSAAPLTVAVYTTDALNDDDGVNVAVWVAALYVSVPGTELLLASLRTNVIVPDWTDSLNVAVTVVMTDTPVAPLAGVRELTVGGVVSVVPPPPRTKTGSTQ
jgi:hypothetical protein